ncbi:glycosyltransferase involved in cell wall biosynthesis [Tamilnaduibacter salinus]|uniref:Glycosyltransferase involved in cell wall biosynthesis n=1 Tax=Tamilnaduibacter salinus TaxID=1484056 RepID=A0A2U1CUT6_9GAMM|nr:glycosyltransferase family 4 protein [Tamilnaduibacter salinus]PVY70819.1 glycosyltransferase involved in cell wall biosynthesis [Tamilnaduibacter salinus]
MINHNKMPRVLFFSAYLPSKGGTIRRLQHWARMLKDSCHITILYGAPDNSITNDVVRRELGIEQNITLISISAPPYLRGGLVRLKAAKKAWDEFGSGDHDIVIPMRGDSETITAGIIKLRDRLKRKRPGFVSCCAGENMPPIAYKGRMKGRLYRLLIRWAYCTSEMIIAITPSLKRYLHQQGISENRIQVIPISVRYDPDHSEVLHQRPFVFGIVSRLTASKGISLAIHAFNNMKFKGDAQFRIYGSGPEEALARQLVKDLSLTNVITFHGYEKPEVAFGSIDCGILASESEGLPRSILEAGSLGVPYIATNVGGVPDLIVHHENGWLFECGNKSELTYLMEYVLRNKESVRLAGNNMREIVKYEYSGEIEKNRLLGVINNISYNGSL